jgi:phage terminase large subunit-like protein
VITAKDIARWKKDPCAYIADVLVNPETGAPFELYPAQANFLRRALTLQPDGTLPYPELLYSAPKKSGKTGLAAMAALYVVPVLGGPFAEGYCLSNDEDQSRGRVFQAIGRIIEASPLLKDSAKITANVISFPSTGSTITALASDFAGNAGANPTITLWDENWGYRSEASRRLWDEMCPVPTRKVSVRLSVTYAGYSGESKLLEELYKRGLKGAEVARALYEQPGMLMFWSHEPVAPWQTKAWLDQMRAQLRPNAYLRLIENRWVTSESAFVEMADWDKCIDPDLSPELTNHSLPVYVGVDASIKRDSTAVVCCAFDQGLKKVRLVWHKVFQPTKADPLDFEATIEQTLLDLRRRFYLREVRFDPYQMVASAQRLAQQGVPMVEFPQTVGNLTEASSSLRDLIAGHNLVAYPDAEMRLAAGRAVALETSRGWRIAKEKQSHKIDSIVALAQAALGAVKQGQDYATTEVTPVPRREHRFFRETGGERQPDTAARAEAEEDASSSGIHGGYSGSTRRKLNLL